MKFEFEFEFKSERTCDYSLYVYKQIFPIAYFIDVYWMTVYCLMNNIFIQNIRHNY